MFHFTWSRTPSITTPKTVVLIRENRNRSTDTTHDSCACWALLAKHELHAVSVKSTCTGRACKWIQVCLCQAALLRGARARRLCGASGQRHMCSNFQQDRNSLIVCCILLHRHTSVTCRIQRVFENVQRWVLCILRLLCWR
jgi:hypothetical protein